MSELYPPLLVAVPILGAAVLLVLGLRFERAGWPVAAATAVLQFGIAVALAATVFATGPVSHELGGFPAPFGIALLVDAVSAIVALLVAFVAAWVLVYARRAGPRENAFYTLYLLLVAGLSGMSVTADLFNLYVFLEITGLAAYGLVASGRSGEAAIAALKYLIVGTMGASLYLLGVGYAFIATGTLNMADFARLLGEQSLYATPLVVAAFALMASGLTIKIALYPVHSWQPDAYANAPDTVSIYISALVSTVSAYALGRVLFSAFTVDFLDAVPMAQDLLVAIAAISVIAGSVLAVLQTEIKRTLAYSSVSQFGLVVVAFGLANYPALVGAVIHLVGHAVMKGGLFAAAGVIDAKTGARTVDEYAGIAHRAPVACGSFAVLAVAMVGVPPAVGFIGKLYIIIGAFEARSWLAASVLLASTLLTLMYFARLVERMYFADSAAGVGTSDGGAMIASPTTDGGDEALVSRGMVAVAVSAAVIAVVLGFTATGVEQLLEEALVALLQR